MSFEITLAEAAAVIADGGQLSIEQITWLLWDLGPTAKTLLEEATWKERHRRDPQAWPKPLSSAEREALARQKKEREESGRYYADMVASSAERERNSMAPTYEKAKPQIIRHRLRGGGYKDEYLPDTNTVLAAQREGRPVEVVVGG